MDQDDRFPSPTPDDAHPIEPRDADPLHIVEATPGHIGDRPEAAPTVPTYPGPDSPAPTEVIPVVDRFNPPVAAPTGPGPFGDERHPAWPFLIGLVALLLGGLIGFFISEARDSDDAQTLTSAPITSAPAGDITQTLDTLLTRTRENGEYLTPSEYPQIDEITQIDNAAATRDLQSQVDLLTEAQDGAGGLTEQVATLDAALTDMTAERDALAAQIADGDAATTEQQAALDAANEQVATVEAELESALTDLAAANQQVTDAAASLQTAVTERDAALATIEALNIVPNPDYVDGPVTTARTDATANGWTIIEMPTESTTAEPGTVLEQAPPANSNMIDGSVLYLTVAEAP